VSGARPFVSLWDSAILDKEPVPADSHLRRLAHTSMARRGETAYLGAGRGSASAMRNIAKLLKVFLTLLVTVSLVTCISNNTPSCVLLGSNGTVRSIFRAAATSGCPTSGGGGGSSCSSTLTPTEVLFSQSSTGAITTLAINTGGNALALMCTTATAVLGQIVVANANGSPNYLYAMKLTAGSDSTTGTATINGFAIGHVAPVTLTPLSPTSFTISGTNFFSGTSVLQADPLGNFLTLTDEGASLVHVLLISSNGTLSEAPGSPFPAANALFTAVGPGEGFLYVSDNSDGEIFIFQIDLSSLTDVLTPIVNSPFQVPAPNSSNAPITMLLSPLQNFLYTANNQSISFYTINGDGSLSLAAGSPVTPAPLFNPQFLAMDSTGTYLYVTGTSTEGVLGYTMNQSTGGLTLIPGSPFASGTTSNISAVEADPSLAVLYLVINGVINPYTIGTATGGVLTAPTVTPTFTASTNIAIASVQ